LSGRDFDMVAMRPKEGCTRERVLVEKLICEMRARGISASVDEMVKGKQKRKGTDLGASSLGDNTLPSPQLHLAIPHQPCERTRPSAGLRCMSFPAHTASTIALHHKSALARLK
jgi:hypothetical protein